MPSDCPIHRPGSRLMQMFSDGQREACECKAAARAKHDKKSKTTEPPQHLKSIRYKLRRKNCRTIATLSPACWQAAPPLMCQSVVNSGPAAANNSVLTDPAAEGLSCNTVTCSGTARGAACPTAGSTTIASLQAAGIGLPTLPGGSTLTFALQCNVLAKGL